MGLVSLHSRKQVEMTIEHWGVWVWCLSCCGGEVWARGWDLRVSSVWALSAALGEAEVCWGVSI